MEEIKTITLKHIRFITLEGWKELCSDNTRIRTKLQLKLYLSHYCSQLIKKISTKGILSYCVVETGGYNFNYIKAVQ